MKLFDWLRLLARATKYRSHKDHHELIALLEHLRPGDTAIDIGAHKGAYTYWLARTVGPRGRVIAFEPQPTLAARLSTLFAWRGWPHVTVEHRGLSNRPGSFTLYRPAHADSPGATLNRALHPNPGSTLEVEVDTLDAYIARHAITRVRAIKCDVEGHELNVFEGARQTLERDHPALLFECEARHHTAGPMDAVFRFLESLGYRGEFFLKNKLLPLEHFNPKLHQQLSTKPYVNNFLFTHQAGATPEP